MASWRNTPIGPRPNSNVALVQCRNSCYRQLRRNLTEDQEGNCWYWSTDGECVANPDWMGKSCLRSCRKLAACAAQPHSAQCAAPHECPLQRDTLEEAECARRAEAGECRSKSIWRGDSLLLNCPYTCSVVDPAPALPSTWTTFALGASTSPPG